MSIAESGAGFSQAISNVQPFLAYVSHQIQSVSAASLQSLEPTKASAISHAPLQSVGQIKVQEYSSLRPNLATPQVWSFPAFLGFSEVCPFQHPIINSRFVCSG